LREQALRSLKTAGNEQKLKYDFSLKNWIEMRKEEKAGKFLFFSFPGVGHRTHYLFVAHLLSKSLPMSHSG
jgi:hypothetical protein